MPRRPVFHSVIILSFISFLGACHQPEVPEYLGFQQVQIEKAGSGQSLLSAQVRFYNPNAFGMQLRKAEMDIFLNGQLANHYLLDSTINIRAKDSFWVPVRMQVDLRRILAGTMRSLLNDELKIKLEGHAKIRRNGFSFRVPINYEETERMSKLLKGFLD